MLANMQTYTSMQ